MPVCPLCRTRKGKRACPAKAAQICSVCCGAKRRVEIDCPEDCTWLGAHAGAWEGRENERLRDAQRLGPYIETLSAAQAQLLLVALAAVPAIRARQRGLDDHLFHEALIALRRTVETRERGVLYEHTPDDLRALPVVAELAGLFEARGSDGAVHAPPDAELLAALKALDAAVQAARAEGEGRFAFLDTAVRLAGRLGAEARRHAPRLIVEP
jgi:hypothetical protein